MNLTFDVIVIGSYTIDIIFSGLQEFPQLGKDILSTDLKITPGEAFISAVCLHRLGLKVGWAADFGNDEFSLRALNCARDEGLKESLFVFHDRSFRRVSMAASFPGDNGFISYYDPDPKIPAALPALTKAHAKVLYIPGLYYGPLLNTGLKLARMKQMKLVMDGNSSAGDIHGNSRESRAIRKALRSMDVFLPNARETRRLTGEQNLETAIQHLGDLCPCVVVKDGSNGSIAYTQKNLFEAPGIPVSSIDTVGAGDNFNAGFLRAWMDNQPMQTCLQWGNITGGLSTTELGGTTFKITEELVRQALSKYYPA